MTYRLTATLSEGTQDFVITDALPQGLVPISANLVATGSGIAAGPPVITIGGQTVEFDFGTVVNTGNNVAGDGTVIVEIEARVANAASNVAGRVLDNLATALIASPTSPNAPGGTVTDGASAAAEVVTPALIVDKSADTPFAAIGETVTYTIVVSHTPGSTAPAFDVVIDDPLAPGVMRLVSGTVITSEGIVLIGNGSGDGSIRIVVPELLLGQTVTITYSVEIIGVPTPAGAAINTAVVSGSSAPDEVPAEFVRNVSASDDAEVSISSGGFFPPAPRWTAVCSRTMNSRPSGRSYFRRSMPAREIPVPLCRSPRPTHPAPHSATQRPSSTRAATGLCSFRYPSGSLPLSATSPTASRTPCSSMIATMASAPLCRRRAPGRSTRGSCNRRVSSCATPIRRHSSRGT